MFHIVTPHALLLLADTALAAASAVSPTWTPTTRSFVGARASATLTAVLSAEVQLAGASSWRGVP